MDTKQEVEKGIQISSERTKDNPSEVTVEADDGVVRIQGAGACQEVCGNNGLG